MDAPSTAYDQQLGAAVGSTYGDTRLRGLQVLCDGVALPLVGVTIPNVNYNHVELVVGGSRYAEAAKIAIALFYSLLLYAFLLLVGVAWLRGSRRASSPPLGASTGTGIRRTSVLFLLLSVFLAFGSSEVLKAAWKQPRPVGSCVRSYGHPSGHSAVAVAALTFFLLEIVRNHRWRDMFADGSTHASEARQLVAKLPVVGGAAASLLVLVLRGRRTQLGQAIGGVVFCLPVGPSRVVLNDHSVSQVQAGMLLGAACGLAVVFLVNAVRPRLQRVPWKARGILHDLADVSVGSSGGILPV